LLANYTSVFGNTATVGDVIRIRVTTLDGETSLRSAAVLASDIVA
jgi:ribosomal protein S28E/S33